jgi:hypothetical protein
VRLENSIRPEDLREMRRLREEEDLLMGGYEPVYDDQREPWLKLHAGDVLTRAEALQQIREERFRKGRC